MDANTAREIILPILAAAAQVEAGGLGDDTRLGADGLGLDSIATLELLLAIEEATGRGLRSEALTGDDLATLGGLVRYVCSL